MVNSTRMSQAVLGFSPPAHNEHHSLGEIDSNWRLQAYNVNLLFCEYTKEFYKDCKVEAP